MRAAVLANTSLAAAKVVPNPATTALSSGQAASSMQLNTEKLQEQTILSKNRGPSIPKKTDAIFEIDPLDPNKEGVTADSLEKKGFNNTKKLLGVA